MIDFKLEPPEKPYYFGTVEKGQAYWYCACGKSDNQPFCDASHKGSGIGPIKYVAETTKDVFFCGCGKSNNLPHCDGSHKS